MDLGPDLWHRSLRPSNTNVIGSSGVDPGPESGVIGLLSSMVFSIVAEVYKVIRSRWLMIPSTAAMQRLSDLIVRGSDICPTLMRPRKSSFKYAALFEGIAPSYV